MIRVHSIQTGYARLRPAQARRRPGGALRVLLDRAWGDWLPIHAWLIEHPEGNILVDTGETAKILHPGYLPRWHPFFRLCASFQIEPADELGPQLKKAGVSSHDIQTVILTHLHSDHSGGLAHLSPDARCLVARGELDRASGTFGQALGYISHRWPKAFRPAPIEFKDERFGPFTKHQALTRAGDVVVVPTPGHTPDHVSIIVECDGVAIFLAGDATYSEAQLLGGWADGVSPQPKTQLQTLGPIKDFVQSRPTVYLPSHDPDSANRLLARQVTQI